MYNKNGCWNCEYFIYYSGTYDTPSDAECDAKDVTDEEIETVFSDVLEWGQNEKPKCHCWKLDKNAYLD